MRSLPANSWHQLSGVGGGQLPPPSPGGPAADAVTRVTLRRASEEPPGSLQNQGEQGTGAASGCWGGVLGHNSS